MWIAMKKHLSTIILGTLLLIVSVLSLFIGVMDLDLSRLLSGGGEMERSIFLLARIPRLLAILCTGVGMSVSGLIMYNSNSLGLMGTESQLNIIAKELGANNLSESVGEAEKATHGEEASWETILKLDPEYMFILDRSTATETADESVMGIREVIENDLIKALDVYKDGKIVYFNEHANVWYTSTGGIQALNTMLADMEGALLY